MLPVGFEPTISEGERPQTYVLDGAATGNDKMEFTSAKSRMPVFPKFSLSSGFRLKFVCFS